MTEGLIVDVDKGWVVVDRSVVFSMLGDVKLVFNNRLEVTGKVEYIHPLHNLALVSYPPESLGNISVTAATINSRAISHGDPVKQIGLNYDGEAEYRTTTVDSIQELWLREYNVPQYIDQNLDVVHLIDANSAVDGVLVNSENEVTALWSTFNESGENFMSSTSSARSEPERYGKSFCELLTTLFIRSRVSIGWE